jgi:hypothetical protein
MRTAAPIAAGTVVSRNFWAGVKPHSGPRKSTKTDQRLQTEKPMCSERIEKARLRRATRSPVSAQNVGSSGRQSSIQCGRARVVTVGVAEGVVIAAIAGDRTDRGFPCRFPCATAV